MKRILLSAALLLAPACRDVPRAPGGRLDPVKDAPAQILWQRSLEDALALCASTGRPLLVAMNMDGESASERIVRENYRDPVFVARTRPFVCVVGSVFRHSLRDHDEQGRRVPCPRLGEVTCGEHIALEPILFDKYLGGERIAPRHALVLRDGTKAFDEFLLYDLRELDRILADAARQAPPPAPLEAERLGPKARSNRGRLAYEDRLPLALDLTAQVDALAREGDRGSIDALRRLQFLSESAPPAFAVGLARRAAELGLAAEYAAVLRRRSPELPAVLDALAVVDADSGETRTLGRAARAIAGSEDGPWPLADVLERSRALIGGPPVSDARPPAVLADLEQGLERAGEAVQRDAQSFEARGRFGRAALDLARARIEAGFTRDVPLLLQDAAHWLAKAAELGPQDLELVLARAEASWRLSEFEAEEEHALAALALSGAEAAIMLGRKQREALRWVGDATARNLAAHAQDDDAAGTAAIRRGAFALQRVALTPAAGESDWLALASFHGLLGMRMHEREYLRAGVLRQPESQALRAGLADACWRAGDLDPLTRTAQEAIELHPQSGAAQWYLGVAWMQRAEWARRGERPEDAIREYQGAERAFERCAELEQGFAGSCTFQRASCRLGQGFAHLLADRRKEAAERLVEALALAPAVATQRDGLEREPVDLLDGSLEWRASGTSPVDALALLDCLSKADPANAFWARSLSDSELREARRAQHRGVDGEALRYATIAVRAARRALALSDDEDTRRALWLPLSLQAELLLAQGDLAAAKPLLAELAQALELSVPASEAPGAWKALGAALREKLGEAAPIARPGR